jgi:hypothetical protein
MLSRLRIDATTLLLLPGIPPFEMANAMRKCRPSEQLSMNVKRRTDRMGKRDPCGEEVVMISTIRRFVIRHECLYLHSVDSSPDRGSMPNVPKAPDAEAKAQSSFVPQLQSK